MATVVDSKVRIPGFVRFFDPLAKRLLGAGVAMGPNALITVGGRKSGLPRTTPVALVEVDGRRWVQTPFGEVNWVRNLRTSGEATLTVGRREESVTAVELNTDEAEAFYTEVLVPYIRRLPLPVQWIGGSLLGFRDALKDPAKAAREHPVFELRVLGPYSGPPDWNAREDADQPVIEQESTCAPVRGEDDRAGRINGPRRSLQETAALVVAQERKEVNRRNEAPASPYPDYVPGQDSVQPGEQPGRRHALDST